MRRPEWFRSICSARCPTRSCAENRSFRVSLPGLRFEFRGSTTVMLTLALFAGDGLAQREDLAQRFRIQVHEDGVYRVAYDHLKAAGLDAPIPSEKLALANLGQPVAVRVDDGGDGRFGPGDSLVFVGRHLRGETGEYHEFSPFNVYVLDTAERFEPLRMTAAAALVQSDMHRAPSALSRRIRKEQNLLRVPVAGPTGRYDQETLWYWKQLNHLASAPTRIPVDLSGLDLEADEGFTLKLQFLGGSDSASAENLPIPDHVVEISLNGTLLDGARWSGRETFLVEIPAIPAALVEPGRNEIEIRIPSRSHADNPDPIIDVLYLDWLEIKFPRDLQLPKDQERVIFESKDNTGKLQLLAGEPSGGGPRAQPVELFTAGGFHSVATETVGGADGTRLISAMIPPDIHQIWLVPKSGFRGPSGVELDRPSNLATRTDQRDYFLIAHSSLVEATRPLAEFHQHRGTRTELIDVQDIYDEFNFGIKHPVAIRDFLAHARQARKSPAAGLVLLVGDASWAAGLADDDSFGEGRFDNRDLIPTWQLRSRDGPAASDNPYVTLSGDDLYPDMAIGRLPAANPEELRLMVDKTVAYMRARPPGAWRSRVTLVSDSTRNLSARNDHLAQRASASGLIPQELLAYSGESGELHQSRLRSALNDGMLLLHFFGHGGRFMWQTAPSRGDANNLFDMDDLDLLEPSARLPIVLSMSCATGPFDHPGADSLAEKFLRIQNRGAVAVVAASARNYPSITFTNRLLDRLFNRATLGEAFRMAKHARQHPDSAIFYNLFGDPALVAARPEGSIALELVGSGEHSVRALLPFDDFAGYAEVEWLGEDIEPTTEKLEIEGATVLLSPPNVTAGQGYRRVNIYVRDPSSNRDASGTLSLKGDSGVSD